MGLCGVWKSVHLEVTRTIDVRNRGVRPNGIHIFHAICFYFLRTYPLSPVCNEEIKMESKIILRRVARQENKFIDSQSVR